MSVFVQLGVLGFAASMRCAWADVKVDARCKTNTWTTNQLGQDPCTVGAKLQAQCLSGDFEIAALSGKDTYVGPLQGESNPCACSSITYSVISACAACQNELWVRWARWSANCTERDISISTYTQPLPPDISVPVWAFENVTIGGAWNIQEALKIHNQGIPDLTADTLSPSSISSSSAPSSSASQVSSSSGNSTNNKGGNDDDNGDDGDHDNGNENQDNDKKTNSSNAGAIAGGVIGGVVGLSVLVLAWVCYNKRRKRTYKNPRVFFDASDDRSDLGKPRMQSPAPTVEPYVIPTRGVDLPSAYHPSAHTILNNRSAVTPSIVSANHSHGSPTSPSPFPSISPIPSPPPPNTAYGSVAYYGRSVPMHATPPADDGNAAGYTGAAEL